MQAVCFRVWRQFTVEKGEVCVLLGPSGSGKSTLLNIIGAIDKPGGGYVAIGRAVVKNPDILLCDEPPGALDYKTSKEILGLIEDCNRKYGTTAIMVVLMFFINLFVILRRLQLSPLQFLRRELRKQRRAKARRLPAWSFLRRFRLRVLLQNMDM